MHALAVGKPYNKTRTMLDPNLLKKNGSSRFYDLGEHTSHYACINAMAPADIAAQTKKFGIRPIQARVRHTIFLYR